jgi:NADH dehydrogenase
VGGGPTGVEVAGALPELIATVFARDFAPELAQRARVTLLEATQTLLPAFHPSLRQYTAQTLRSRHVDVRFGAQVTAIGPDAIYLKDGTSIATRTVIWGAGVKAHPLAAMLGLPLGRGGRVAINDDLSVPGQPDVFVIGDMAAGKDTAGQIYPQLAQGAMQSGKHVAGNIAQSLQGRAPLPFAYRDPGFMATIGRHAAVAQFPFGLRASGVLAWWMWLVLHLVQLVGLRNRAQVLLNWTWNYLRGYKHPLLYGQQSRAPPDMPARP